MNNTEDQDDQDPDYAVPGPSNGIHQQIFEETARKTREKKIIDIVNKEFTKEIDTKEKEILKIQNRLDEALKTLHFLRTVIVTDYYNKSQCQVQVQGKDRQSQIHPAIKKLIGKSPKLPNYQATPSTSSKDPKRQSIDKLSKISPENTKISSINLSQQSLKSQGIKKTEKRKIEETTNDDSSIKRKKIPQYVPPKKSLPDPLPPSRGEKYKMVKRIIIGNFASLLPEDSRLDKATHKWKIYVNGPKDEPDISKFVSKVKFFLDPSYKPNDVVTVTNRPFELTRRGWGEFPIRVTLYFHDSANKSRDIVYNLKLFKKHPASQGPVAENWYDIYIYRPNCSDVIRNTNYSDKSKKNKDKITNNFDVLQDFCKVDEENILEDKNKTISHVQYEHDYVDFISLGYKFDYKGEKHVTISHSPTKYCDENDELNNKLSHIKEQHNGNDVNGDLNKKITTICGNNSQLLAPLHINIPSAIEVFENEKKLLNGGNKKVTLLNGNILDKQNNKTVINHSNGIKNNELILSKNNNSINQDKCLVKNLQNNIVCKKLINFKLDPSKSLLLNSNSNIPALKIANQLQPTFKNNEKLNNINGNCIENIGKNRFKNDEDGAKFVNILELIEKIEIKDTEALIRFIAKRIPLITENALMPNYRKIHPYAVESEEEFLSYSVGKQRALELYRAKAIRSLLKRKKIPDEEIWTLKELMTWCRFHGFTPVRSSLSVLHQVQKSSKFSGKSVKTTQENSHSTPRNTCTEPAQLIDWIKSSKKSQNNNLCDDDEIIDVENVDVEIKIEKLSPSFAEKKESLLMLEVPEEILDLHSYVCQSTRQIGVKLGPEEIIPGVSHPAASHLLAKVTEHLLEDLLRSSLARAFERSTNKSCPESITLDDVRSAILSRDEFDIFTNSGLGTQEIDD